MEFAILGAVEVVVDGRPVPVGGSKQRALLALLLLNANEVVSRDRLVEGLWGERPPLSGQRSLESYVSRLRGLLGAERIERKAPGYRILVGAGELDLQRFEALLEEGRALAGSRDARGAVKVLRRALELWRGPALADVRDEYFAGQEAEWLEERRLVALEARIACEITIGGDQDLVPELERLVARYPFREQLVASLMLGLYRAGRQADALAAYQGARRRLAEDLGLEPGPQLRELERGILEHDPRLGTPPTPGAARRVRRVASRRRVVVAGCVMAAVVVSGVVGIKLWTGLSPASVTAVASARVVELGSRSTVRGRGAPLTAAASAMVAESKSLWVAQPDAGAIVRIDRAASRVEQRITLGGNPGAIALGAGAVWVAEVPGATISRIDPATETLTQTIELGGARVDALAFGLGALWVADSTDRSLLEFDPGSGALRRTIELDASPTTMAVGARLIWVADYGAGSLTGVDARSGETVTTVPVGNGPTAIALGGGAVWVANSLDSTVSRVDPLTSSVSAVIPVASAAVSLAADAESVWVASRYSGTVSRIDQRSNLVVDISRVGGGPAALATDGGRIWVATNRQERNAGGTLVLLHTRPISIDPALQLDLFPLQSDGLTRDGLVTYNHVSGPKGFASYPTSRSASRSPLPAVPPTPFASAQGSAIRTASRCALGTSGAPSSVSSGFARPEPITSPASSARGPAGSSAATSRPASSPMTQRPHSPSV